MWLASGGVQRPTIGSSCKNPQCTAASSSELLAPVCGVLLLGHRNSLRPPRPIIRTACGNRQSAAARSSEQSAAISNALQLGHQVSMRHLLVRCGQATKTDFAIWQCTASRSSGFFVIIFLKKYVKFVLKMGSMFFFSFFLCTHQFCTHYFVQHI